jgi:hypothetical protein
MAPCISRVLLFAAALAGASMVQRPVLAADPQEQRLAQTLFDEGRRLMEEKRYGEACPKLVESQRLDPGGGTLLNLAICHEKEGKLATALNDFDEALALAVRDGRKDRQKIAAERKAAVALAVPRVIVVVGAASDIEGLEVKLDGLVLRRAAWDVATPVDPGSHVVEAAATGRAPWSRTVQVDAAQKKTIDVPVLGALASLPPGGIVGASLVATEGGLGMQRPAAPADEPLLAEIRPSAPPANPLFYTVLSATLAMVGTSAMTGIFALSAHSDAKAGCVPDRKYCRDEASADAADRAATLAWVSTVSLGLAAVGTVALFLIPSRTSAPRSPFRGSAQLVPGGGSVGLAGSF